MLFRSLVEFAKSKSYDKSLVHIQPVKINKQFFQMPTPLKASTRDIEYAKQYGGGIDIMARIRVKGYASNKNNRLVIFELKDENTKKEPVDKVILQAVAYATFIGIIQVVSTFGEVAIHHCYQILNTIFICRTQ